MIVLNNTDRLLINLGGAVKSAELECFASYRDTTATTIAAKRNSTLTNGASYVTLVGAPAASTQRVVDYLSVYNADIKQAKVIVTYDLNGIAYILASINLEPGEKLEYQEGKGFKTFTANGSIKLGNELNYGGPISGVSSTTLTVDRINNNPTLNTIQDITGLSFSVNAGTTYWFRFIIPYNAAVTTTGSRFSVNGPAFAYLYYESFNSVASGGAINFTLGFSAYDLPAASSASSALTGNVAMVEGIVRPSSSGTLIARFASEVANSAITARAGAIVYYKELF